MPCQKFEILQILLWYGYNLYRLFIQTKAVNVLWNSWLIYLYVYIYKEICNFSATLPIYLQAELSFFLFCYFFRLIFTLILGAYTSLCFVCDCNGIRHYKNSLQAFPLFYNYKYIYSQNDTMF